MGHIFGTNNYLDTATLSMISGTENAQFPLSNLKVPITGQVFRIDATSCSFLIDLGSTKTVDTFMLVGDNIEGLGVTGVTLAGSATTNFGSSTPITVALSATHNFGFVLNGGTYRYWRVSLTGSTKCELSNIYIGQAVTLTTNAIALGSFMYTTTENVTVDKNNYGNRFFTTYNTLKTLSGKLHLLNTTELASVRSVVQTHGKSVPVWFITDPTDAMETDAKYRYSGFFYFTQNNIFTNTNTGLWSLSLELSEVA